MNFKKEAQADKLEHKLKIIIKNIKKGIIPEDINVKNSLNQLKSLDIVLFEKFSSKYYSALFNHNKSKNK